ncbi:MAG: four helix bundle protein [Patescibacteria group bacterium]|nr:four helix bundle protein [Patescibacteria group bacterium]
MYSLSRKLPKQEIFAITSQLRRAVLSIPLNITEGFARQNKKEYKRFLEIAYGSLKEMKYLLHFTFTEKYLQKEDYQNSLDLAEELGKLLWVSIQTLKKGQ